MTAVRFLLTFLLAAYCLLGLLLGLIYLFEAVATNSVYLALEAAIELPGNILVLTLGLMGMYPSLRPEAWR